MIFHIPHASILIPAENRPSIILNEKELSAELLKITDAYTDELFGVHSNTEDTVIEFPVSRLVLDPERFVDDEKEIMSKVGMGVIYTKTSSGKTLRHDINPEERETLIEKYYRPHHRKLTDAVRKEIDEYGFSLIIDCHSFPYRRLPCELDRMSRRPDICIGTDKYHTPDFLLKLLKKLFKKQNLKVSINRPFCGTLVPPEFYMKNKNVFSIMIEINRKLYMDKKTGQKTNDFIKIQNLVKDMIKVLRVNGDLYYLRTWHEDCGSSRICKYPWYWKEDRVDKKKQHFELKYGDLNKVEPKDFIPVALVSRHYGCKCHVEFILDRKIKGYEKIIERAKREINFYLIELKERNPIAYLRYHCNTTSNFFSHVHWFVRSGIKRQNIEGRRIKNYPDTK